MKRPNPVAKMASLRHQFEALRRATGTENDEERWARIKREEWPKYVAPSTPAIVAGFRGGF